MLGSITFIKQGGRGRQGRNYWYPTGFQAHRPSISTVIGGNSMKLSRFGQHRRWLGSGVSALDSQVYQYTVLTGLRGRVTVSNQQEKAVCMGVEAQRPDWSTRAPIIRASWGRGGWTRARDEGESLLSEGTSKLPAERPRPPTFFSCVPRPCLVFELASFVMQDMGGHACASEASTPIAYRGTTGTA